MYEAGLVMGVCVMPPASMPGKKAAPTHASRAARSSSAGVMAVVGAGGPAQSSTKVPFLQRSSIPCCVSVTEASPKRARFFSMLSLHSSLSPCMRSSALATLSASSPATATRASKLGDSSKRRRASSRSLSRKSRRSSKRNRTVSSRDEKNKTARSITTANAAIDSAIKSHSTQREP